MTINVQNCSNVNVIGHHNHKNCKPVYCIDTGEIYASALDAANANGVVNSTMSSVLTGNTKTCNGKRFCYVSKMIEHLEEINQANRVRSAKVAAYDADAERRDAITKAEEDVKKYESKTDELRRQLQDTQSNLEDAKSRLYKLKHND